MSDPSPSAPEHWRRTLWSMVGLQMLMTTSISFPGPIMPLLLPELGVVTVEAIGVWTGLITGSMSFVAAFASPIWGRISDRRGRKLSLLRSSIAIAFFTVLMGLVSDVWQLFGIRVLMGCFVGFTAAGIALTASQVPEERLGWALGLLSTGQLVGLMIGPMAAGALADLTDSYRVPFFVIAAVTASVPVLVWWLVREDFTPPTTAGKQPSVLAGLRGLAASSGVMALFCVLLMAQFSVRTVEPVVTLFVLELAGDVPNIALLAGMAFSISGLANLIAAPVMGTRSDVLGHRRVLLIALAGSAAAAIPQIWVESYWLFLAERFAMGLFTGGILPTANALIGRAVPREKRGSVYGMTASASFLGTSLGPLTGGLIGANLGIRWVFALTAALLMANLVWVWAVVLERRDG